MDTLTIEGHKLVNAKSISNAGGIAMYVSDHLDIRLANQFNIDCHGCEELWIKVRLKNNLILLTCVIYKHPGQIDVKLVCQFYIQMIRNIHGYATSIKNRIYHNT